MRAHLPLRIGAKMALVNAMKQRKTAKNRELNEMKRFMQDEARCVYVRELILTTLRNQECAVGQYFSDEDSLGRRQAAALAKGRSGSKLIERELVEFSKCDILMSLLESYKHFTPARYDSMFGDREEVLLESGQDSLSLLYQLGVPLVEIEGYAFNSMVDFCKVNPINKPIDRRLN